VPALQVVSVVGAMLILLAYGANQLGKLGPERRSYSLLNLVGSATLSVIAIVEHQWGFLLLESVWAVVSFWGLLRTSGSDRQTN